jgi:hypothetical protein
MAGGAPSLWGASELLGSFFGGLATPPASYFFALIRDTAPNPFLSGGELDEPPVEAGYVRLEVLNNSSAWTRDQDFVTNIQVFNFAAATLDWGMINYWAMCNAPVGGEVYIYGEFIEPQSVVAGDFAVIDVGSLSISLGPIFATAPN